MSTKKRGRKALIQVGEKKHQKYKNTKIRNLLRRTTGALNKTKKRGPTSQLFHPALENKHLLTREKKKKDSLLTGSGGDGLDSLSPFPDNQPAWLMPTKPVGFFSTKKGGEREEEKRRK